MNHERNEIINIKKALQEPKKGHMEKRQRNWPAVCAENSSVNNWPVFRS